MYSEIIKQSNVRQVGGGGIPCFRNSVSPTTTTATATIPAMRKNAQLTSIANVLNVNELNVNKLNVSLVAIKREQNQDNWQSDHQY